MFHMASLKMGLDQAVLNGFETGSSGEVRKLKLIRAVILRYLFVP
jgi:hypothetical protein